MAFIRSWPVLVTWSIYCSNHRLEPLTVHCQSDIPKALQPPSSSQSRISGWYALLSIWSRCCPLKSFGKELKGQVYLSPLHLFLPTHTIHNGRKTIISQSFHWEKRSMEAYSSYWSVPLPWICESGLDQTLILTWKELLYPLLMTLSFTLF